MPQKLFNAIGFDRAGRPYKYRNIVVNRLDDFEKFAITDKGTKPPLMYVNYYNSITKKFEYQKRLIDE